MLFSSATLVAMIQHNGGADWTTARCVCPHFVARTVPVRVEGLSMLVSGSERYLVNKMGIPYAALESASSTGLYGA